MRVPKYATVIYNLLRAVNCAQLKVKTIPSDRWRITSVTNQFKRYNMFI